MKIITITSCSQTMAIISELSRPCYCTILCVTDTLSSGWSTRNNNGKSNRPKDRNLLVLKTTGVVVQLLHESSMPRVPSLPTIPLIDNMALSRSSIQAFANVALLFAMQILIPAGLIVATPKYSWLRYLGLVFISLSAYLIFQLAPSLSNSIFHNSFLACEGILVVAHCTNLLLILQDGGITWSDLQRHSGKAGTTPGPSSETTPFLCKLVHGARLVISLRGVETAWETKNTPQHPSSLGHGGGSRTRFLIRQGSILAWQYLFLDVMLEVTMREPRENTDKFYRPGIEYEYSDLTGEQWFIRAFTPFVSWFVVSRLLLDSTWRALSILSVGSGLASPRSWRPLFGSMWEAYTLRNFWG